MAKKRVLVVTSSYPAGPGEDFIEDELRTMSETEASVIVAPAHPRGVRRASPFAGSTIATCVEPLIGWAVLRDAALTILRHPVRTGQALVFALNGRWWWRNALAFPKGLWLARLVERTRTTHIHAYWLTVPATATAVASVISRVPWSATGHRWDIYADNRLRAKAERAAFLRFISQRGLEDALSLGVVEHKAHLVHLGALVDERATRAWATTSNSTLICAANLIPVKGHDLLLRALALLPQESRPQLVLLGDGELREDLQRLTRELRIDRHVTFCGRVPRSEVIALYDEVPNPVVVLASRNLPGNEHEGIPFSLIEAMARGIPVVATDSGSVRELLAGLPGLVPELDVRALAEVIRQVCLDPLTYEQVAAMGWERVSRNWNARRSVDQLLHLMFVES